MAILAIDTPMTRKHVNKSGITTFTLGKNGAMIAGKNTAVQIHIKAQVHPSSESALCD